MAKGGAPKDGKSSASSGTRKKNAKKAATKQGDAADDGATPGSNKPRQRGEKKLSKAQKKALPKVKQYIPPPKPPAPPIPDPLDGQGLARTLPADLVVILRRLGKKDEVTRRKGLEELRVWIAGLKAGEDIDEVELELKESALLSAAPVWLHNLASLFQSPFHRSLALQLHSELLDIPSIRTSIIDSLSLRLLPGTQNRDVLGSWLVAVLEDGRRSGSAKSWEESTTWTPESAEADSTGRVQLRDHLSSIVEYFSLAILDPASLHDDIHPAPVSSAPAMAAPTARKGGKVKAPVYVDTPAEVAPADDSAVTERLARYRIGGLVGLARILQDLLEVHIAPTPELLSLLRNPVLWSAVSPEEQEDSANVGVDQPGIRKSAYALLEVLIETLPDEVGRAETLELLSQAVLNSCWLEKDSSVWQIAGQAIAKFLSKYRQSWLIASKASAINTETSTQKAESSPPDEENDAETDEEEADDSDGEDEEDQTAESLTHNEAPARPLIGSKPLTDFLGWLSTICPNIPHLTYPLLLVFVSTLPEELLPLQVENGALQTLFTHLWSPVDARLLSLHSSPNQQSGFQQFFSAAADSTVYLVGKAARGDGREAAEWLVRDQFAGRAWSEGVLELGGKGGRRRGQDAGAEVEAELFSKALNRLATIDGSLLGSALPIMRETLSARCFAIEEGGRLANSAASLLARSMAIVNALQRGGDDESIAAPLRAIIEEIVRRSIEGLDKAATADVAEASIFATVIIQAVLKEGEGLTGEISTSLVRLLQQRAQPMATLLSAEQYVCLFESAIKLSPGERTSLSSSFWAVVESPDVDRTARFALAGRSSGSADSVLLSEGALDHVAIEAGQAALVDGAVSSTQLASLAVAHEGAISTEALHTVLALVCTSIHDQVDDLLNGYDESGLSNAALDIVASYAQVHPSELVTSDIYLHALIAVHHLVFLLPRNSLETFVTPAGAAAIWKMTETMSPAEQAIVSERVSAALAEMLGQTSCLIEPSVLVDVALTSRFGGQQRSPADIAKTLLPSTEVLRTTLAAHSSRKPHQTLAIVDSLIPCTDHEAEQSAQAFDKQGRSRAARYADAAVNILRADRQLAHTDIDLLRIGLSAAVFAKDTLDVPQGGRGFFSSAAQRSLLQDVIREVEGTLSFALATVDDAGTGWHQAAVGALAIRGATKPQDFLQVLLQRYKEDLIAADSDIDSRILRDVLSRHLRQSGAGEKEAEIWLAFAMTMIERSTSIVIAVFTVVKPLLLDSERLQTAQNRLASYLTTIKPSQAGTQGVPAMRRLLASAPPADAPTVFLPQQRAIFVLRHIGSWLTSDEADDFDESMEVYVAQLYTALAPVVQDVSGAHWDGIFDLVESGLESSSLSDVSTYNLLYQCLLLLQQTRDLASSNKSLRADWTSKDVQLSLVLKLFLQCREADTIPLQLIQASILHLLSDVSDQAIEAADLDQLCALLNLSSSSVVQSTAYRILSRIIKNRTINLVLEVEASVSEAEDGHVSRTIALPSGLIDVIATSRSADWYGDARVSVVLTQLLAWMAVLDHFEDASRTLRWAYLDQITSAKLLDECLLPMLFAILGVTEVGAWNFPASQFGMDEFYPDLLEPEELADLAPLASHLFYRSLVTLPSAMRTFYESLKDRQLSMSMLNFTARHYSPVIIRHEFSALRQPAALAQLTEEGLNVRIAQGGGATVAAGTGSAEAIASYVVDEQPMEIGIRLPAEFPLRGVEIRDLKRVGVPENKWRGWLMSVQQTITSRNGLILEALTVFKKNVSLHFEGVVECAICYSIISLTDRTLPTKPCRTCKNRFHASCLFKWFNSSHSSSCPMCRALF